MSARRGTVLLVVVGIAAVLLALAMAFLARMRSDGEEARALTSETQARAMLTAALMYVQETARLGWPSQTDPHAEAFGWIDVRDGSPGPKDRDGAPLAAFDARTGVGAAFPAVGGVAARCPMHVLEAPPSAVAPVAIANPIAVDDPATLPSPVGDRAALWRTLVSYRDAEPTRADPTLSFADWRRGRPRPALGVGQAWFRVYRATRADCDAHRTVDGAPAPIAWSPAVFVLTCGAGATAGFRSWPEVVAAGATDEYGSQADFLALRASETVLWYLCEWSAAEGYSTSHHYFPDSYDQSMANTPTRFGDGNRLYSKTFGGTFRWIERLANEPPAW